jgi:energy-coupling factor transporter ATP-binding protein EcfA2
VGAPLEIAIPPQGVVAILGRNGAGKSVLLTAASGASSLSQVEVLWRSTPLHPPILASQYPELQIFEERAEDEVVYTAVSRGVDRGVALEAVRRALDPLGRRGRRMLSMRAHELSAGEKRILQVAGAWAAPAAFRALDEPTAGLDPQARDWLAALIKESALRTPWLIASQDVPWIDRLGAFRVSLEWPGSAMNASLSEKTD